MPRFMLLCVLGALALAGRPHAQWIVVHDDASSAALSADHARLDYALRPGVPHPYAGLILSIPPTDATTGEGVRFRARGRGRFRCLVPTSATQAAHNHFGAPFLVTREWTLVELPFREMFQLWGAKSRFDARTMTGVQWNAEGRPGDEGWLSVQDVELYSAAERRTPPPPPNPIVAEPKVNQVGYLPRETKELAITASAAVRAGDAFTVRDASGRTCLTGRLAAAIDDTTASGEQVLRGAFTALDAPGRYVVRVNDLASPPFEIGAHVYAPVCADALHALRIVRCGAALADPATGLAHAACHTKDPVPGGWHNAGDYGKWTHTTAITCAWLLWLHELEGTRLAARDAALLDEARWGLEWLLAMQRPDGSVLHKIDNEGSAGANAAVAPDAPVEPYDRVARGAGTIDSADFTGALALAARAYRTADPAFAERAHAAARRAFSWVEAHPAAVQRDPFYVDADPAEEKLWALGEMARTANDPALRARFLSGAPVTRLRPPFWMRPQLFGYAALAFDPAVPPEAHAALVQALSAACDELVHASQRSGYGAALTDYDWGSNEQLVNRCCMLLVADRLAAGRGYRAAALRQLDYLLGANALGLSFVTGHGARAIAHPHHWTYIIYGHALPGWLTGGPNRHPEGVDVLLLQLIQRGTPPAKCYYDGPLGTSYGCNEGGIFGEAALVFATGCLSVD